MLTHGDIHLFDVIKLKDGRQGTVIEIYNMPPLPIGYEIEISDNEGITLDLFTATIDEIDSIIWGLPTSR